MGPHSKAPPVSRRLRLAVAYSTNHRCQLKVSSWSGVSCRQPGGNESTRRATPSDMNTRQRLSGGSIARHGRSETHHHTPMESTNATPAQSATHLGTTSCRWIAASGDSGPGRAPAPRSESMDPRKSPTPHLPRGTCSTTRARHARCGALTTRVVTSRRGRRARGRLIIRRSGPVGRRRVPRTASLPAWTRQPATQSSGTPTAATRLRLR